MNGLCPADGSNMSWDGKVPFGFDGQPLDYDGDYRGDEKRGGTRRDNEPFFAVGTYTGTGRGRSAAYFCYNLIQTDGVRWHVQMFMSEMDRIIRTNGLPVGGTLQGTWKFMKRGQNYGIQFLSAAAE